MKIKEVNFSLSHLFVFILILSGFSIWQTKTVFAYDEHSGQAIEPVMTAPQSEGAKIVSANLNTNQLSLLRQSPKEWFWTMA